MTKILKSVERKETRGEREHRLQIQTPAEIWPEIPTWKDSKCNAIKCAGDCGKWVIMARLKRQVSLSSSCD